MINRRLYDIILRHQMYLDGYKVNQVKEWRKLLPQFIKDLKDRFKEVPYDTLDEMTKKELNEFKRNLAKIVLYTFDYWQNQLMKNLEEFTKVETTLQKGMIGNYLVERELLVIEDEKELESILYSNRNDKKKSLYFITWEKLLLSLMGATGLSVEDTIKKIGPDVINRINLLINKGVANKEGVKSILLDIIGDPKLNLKGSALAVIDREAKNITETVLQHVAITIETCITSQFFKRYQWKRVLDSRVCPSCLFLNGQIFYYGAGPTSPYHRVCRCSNVPYTGEMPDEKSVEQWTLQQPQAVQSDLLKSKNISLFEFSGKLNNILTK